MRPSFIYIPCGIPIQRFSLPRMPTFAVQLAEIRRLTPYIEAKNSAAAIRQTRRTWSKLEHSAPLPFELTTRKTDAPSGRETDPFPRAQEPPHASCQAPA